MKRISQLTFGHYRRFLYQIKYLDNMPRLPHVQILFRKPNSLSVDNKRKVLKEGYQLQGNKYKWNTRKSEEGARSMGRWGVVQDGAVKWCRESNVKFRR